MAIKNTKERIIGKDGDTTTIYRQTTAANVLVHEDSTENARAHLHYYAVCGTDAGTAEKAISVAGGSANVLAASVLFTIKFTNGNTAEAPQINVNGQGAKSVAGSNLSMIKAGQLVQLVYNGREFVMKDLLPVAKEETSTTTLYPVMATGEGELEETRISENMKFTKDGGLETNVSASTVSWTDDTTVDTIVEGSDPIPSVQSDDEGITAQSADPTAATSVEEFTSGKTTSALFKIIKKIFTGLGSAAFTNSSDYATAAQGAKADTALQKANLFDGVTYETAGENALDAHTGLTLQNQISDLSSKVTDFENTKSSIVGSALGKALSMTSSTSWNDVVNKIKGVPAYTSGGFSGTSFGVDNRDGAWLYIPKNGYYSTGAWVNIPISDLKSKLGTASQSSVLSGYTFSSSSGVQVTGSMTNYSNTIQTATASGIDASKSCYRINSGYIEISPARGYWGWTAWDKSCIKIPVSTATAVTTAIEYSGSNILTKTDNDNGAISGTYVSKTYINFALFKSVNVSVNLHGGSNAYGNGGWGTVECCIKNSSGTVVASASKTGKATDKEKTAFNGTFSVDVSSFNEVGWIHCNLSCNGHHTWKPNNNGKSKYTGHAEITGISLS